MLVDVVDEIAAAVRVLSRHRYHALLLWNPAIALAGGVVLNARVSRQLLITLFTPESLNELRTGVTVIRGSRVERAAVPLAWQDVVEGASTLATGVAFEVDEDSGEIRHVDQTGHVEVVDVTSLARVLYRRALDVARLIR